MAEKLDFLKRWLATAIAFLFWAVAGTLLQLVLLPFAQKGKQANLSTQLKVRRFCWRDLVLFYSLPVLCGCFKSDLPRI